MPNNRTSFSSSSEIQPSLLSSSQCKPPSPFLILLFILSFSVSPVFSFPASTTRGSVVSLSLSLSTFLKCFVVLGEQSRAGPSARCLCSCKPFDQCRLCMCVCNSGNTISPLLSFLFLPSPFLYLIYSHIFLFFVSVFPLFLSFSFKGTKLGQLAWTPKKHHAPLYPPNPLATFTQISQQLKIENNKKHENHSITRTSESLET